MLVAAGQPVLTDDAWWQIALGRFFRADGPWLESDPLLFAAAGPPRTAAWLWSVGLSEILAAAGFPGLRVFHVLLVAAILGLGWVQLRRAGGSAVVASLGVSVFVALAAYRLVQLRPHLFTMLAVLALYGLLVESRRPPSPRRIGLAAGLAALWANLHAAFPLGLVLIGSAAAGSAAAAVGAHADPDEGRRARRLAAAFAVLLLATFANPAGPAAYAPYWIAGVETPALGDVLDEWRSSVPWRLPVPTLPPSPLAWGLLWLELLGLAWVLQRHLRADRPGARGLDGALIALSLCGVALQLWAVRFLWLGILPLLLLASALRAPGGLRVPVRHPATAGVAVLLVVGFVQWGDWRMISRGLPATWAGYQRAYSVNKYPARAIWLLGDAQLEGDLYVDYTYSGFAGYWLAPRIRTLVNGSLNFSPDVARAMRALYARRGVLPEESFPALLDRLGVDLFLGVGAPEPLHPSRPRAPTTAHLEGTPGWIPIFRTPTSALYLRVHAGNRSNLERVVRFYEEQGIPFDPDRGFDVAETLRRAPGWAVAHGVVPRGFVRLEHAAHAASGPRGAASRARLAALYAALGLYERALALDREILEAEPDAAAARRRLVWSLLRLRRFEEARREADPLAERPEVDVLSHRIARTAHSIEGREAAEIDTALARLPMLYRVELSLLTAGMRSPPARAPRAE